MELEITVDRVSRLLDRDIFREQFAVDEDDAVSEPRQSLLIVQEQGSGRIAFEYRESAVTHHSRPLFMRET